MTITEDLGFTDPHFAAEQSLPEQAISDPQHDRTRRFLSSVHEH